MKPRCMAGILLLLMTAPLAAIAEGANTIYRHIESTGDPIPFAIHLPPDFDAESSYPVLIGPGDAEEGSDPGFYWQTDPHIKGWVIVDAQIWDMAGNPRGVSAADIKAPQTVKVQFVVGETCDDRLDRRTVHSKA